jgi:F-type H+-transporting ATPase subunit a
LKTFFFSAKGSPSVFSFFSIQALPLRRNSKFITIVKSLNKVFSFVILGMVMLLAGQVSAASEGKYDAKEFAMHHVADAHEWHIVGGLTIPLPCIVIHDGLHVFMSNKMPSAHHGAETAEVIPAETHATADTTHGHDSHAIDATAHQSADTHSAHHETYNGFYYSESGRIVHEDGGFTLDLSVTKNVATLLIVSLIMILVFTSVAKAYKRREGEAPKGLQSFMEPLILFVRDEVVRPNLGNKSDKYLPYLLTVFFFIWISNMMGLIPLIANPNLSGNIAVTCALALMTFLITNLHANKYYWGHIFNPPGVPGFVKVILVPIEIAGIFIKPVALMIRLFANITAGHIIIISLVGLIFVFGNAGENLGGGLGGAAVAVPFALFMSVLELLVAFLQAFIFTMLSALFISLAQEDHHHDDHGEHASAAHH